MTSRSMGFCRLTHDKQTHILRLTLVWIVQSLLRVVPYQTRLTRLGQAIQKRL